MKRFNMAIGLAILLIILTSWMDYIPYPEAYFGFSILLGFVAAAMYYIFRKDLSEAAAVFGTYIIMFACGLEDFFFFVFGKGFPTTMPNLNDHWLMGPIREAMGLSDVNTTVLVISVAIGVIASYYLVKYLKKQKW